MKITPFNEQEDEIMNLLIEAHDKFVLLNRKEGHPNELEEWTRELHFLQRILEHRILKRDYPNYFN